MYNKNTGNLKFYEKLQINKNDEFVLKNNPRFKFKYFLKDITDKHDPYFNLDLVMRFDLRDSGISIYSADVLNFFDENFDMNTERDDFIKNLLSSEISH